MSQQIVLLVCFTVLLVGDILMLHLICSTSTMIPHRVSNMGRTCTFQKSLKVGMDRIIYRRAHSSYNICIENCMGEYSLLHACLYDSYLPRYFSHQVHSYLFSFFMRESFSSCSCTFSSCTATHYKLVRG